MEQLAGTVLVKKNPSGTPSQLVVAGFLEKLQTAWCQDRPLPVEEIFRLHPEVFAKPENALRLICEEICLRQDRGEVVSHHEILKRFPQWRSHLEHLYGFLHLLEPVRLSPPRAGRSLPGNFGEFQLLAELGRGAEGQVFLALQPSLAHRPVVLKIIPTSEHEHLSLARLQHTNIVPLYAVYDDPRENVRALCMPYFGNATLKHILKELEKIPCPRRTGKDLVQALDAMQDGIDLDIFRDGPGRKFLANAGYVSSICWIGAQLADALQYAHDRGLVHLDLKPSNILLGSDGQPMLLDFHLAQSPLAMGEEFPPRLGGTPGYMSPEQHQVLEDVLKGGPLSQAITGQSDIFSLGVVLYEALVGKRPEAGEAPEHLHALNPQVSVGLSDIVAKCLAADVGRRYGEGSHLAEDLRRHLEHRPLRRAGNRSLRERWNKWRCRRPFGLWLNFLGFAFLATLAGAGLLTWNRMGEHRGLAEESFLHGKELIGKKRFAEAARVLKRGLDFSKFLRETDPLKGALHYQLRVANRGEKAQKLHEFAQDYLRNWIPYDALPPEKLFLLETGCRETWKDRFILLRREGVELESGLEQTLNKDLLDLALAWSEVHLLLAPPVRKGRSEALQIILQAEELWGPLPALQKRKNQLEKEGK